MIALLLQLAHPALERRHWERILAIVECEYDESAVICVQSLLMAGVMDKLEQVQEVAGTASKEYSMLKMLEKMEKVSMAPLRSFLCSEVDCSCLSGMYVLRRYVKAWRVVKGHREGARFGINASGEIERQFIFLCMPCILGASILFFPFFFPISALTAV
jgi:hypothetical protein